MYVFVPPRKDIQIKILIFNPNILRKYTSFILHICDRNNPLRISYTYVTRINALCTYCTYVILIPQDVLNIQM